MRTGDAIELYLRQRAPEWAELTYRKQRDTLLRFGKAFGDRELDGITAVSLRDWRTTLGVSPVSANKYVDRVRAFLNYAEAEGWMTRSPAARVTPLLEPARQQFRLTNDQLGHVLNAAPTLRERAMLAVSLEWLLRGAEIRELRVGNLRLDDGLADVRVMKQEGVYAWDEMVVTPALARELRAWLDQYRGTVGELAPDDYLFPRADERLRGPRRVVVYSPASPDAHPYRVVGAALDAIGVKTERRGFHTLRRSMARIRYDLLCETDGKDDALSIVSALLHHKSRKTTELYLGVDGDRTRRNKIMKSSAWVSVLTSANSANGSGPGLAKVIPITR